VASYALRRTAHRRDAQHCQAAGNARSVNAATPSWASASHSRCAPIEFDQSMEIGTPNEWSYGAMADVAGSGQEKEASEPFAVGRAAEQAAETARDASTATRAGQSSRRKTGCKSWTTPSKGDTRSMRC
jgi:hypothetical protein